jgi:hypothetical protein
MTEQKETLTPLNQAEYVHQRMLLPVAERGLLFDQKDIATIINSIQAWKTDQEYETKPSIDLKDSITWWSEDTTVLITDVERFVNPNISLPEVSPHPKREAMAFPDIQNEQALEIMREVVEATVTELTENKTKIYIGRRKNPKKTTFSCIAKRKGSTFIAKVYAPQWPDKEKISYGRIIGGSAHEIVHIISAYLCPHLNFPSQVENHLDIAKAGGYKTEGNKQGSEGIGNLMSEAIYYWLDEKEMTLEQAVEFLENDFLRSAKKIFVKGSAKSARYAAAKLALADTIRQIQQMENSGITILDILALGCCGYTSMEKLPSLIEHSVVTREHFLTAKLMLSRFIAKAKEQYHDASVKNRQGFFDQPPA